MIDVVLRVAKMRRGRLYDTGQRDSLDRFNTGPCFSGLSTVSGSVFRPAGTQLVVVGDFFTAATCMIGVQLRSIKQHSLEYTKCLYRL